MQRATYDGQKDAGVGQGREGSSRRKKGLPLDAARTSVASLSAAAPRENRITLPVITLLTRSMAGVDAERLQHNRLTSQQGASAAGEGYGGRGGDPFLPVHLETAIFVE